MRLTVRKQTVMIRLSREKTQGYSSVQNQVMSEFEFPHSGHGLGHYQSHGTSVLC